MSREKKKSHEVCAVVIRNYWVGGLIGSGSFGEIYEGRHRETGLDVAVKLESVNCPHPQLPWEYRSYHKLRNTPDFPRAYWHGVEGKYNVLILQRLGKNLDELLVECGGRFSPGTILTLGRQMIHRIRDFHAVGLLHRDIKPENFVMGYSADPEASRRVFLIDYGLAKTYMYQGKHIPMSDHRSLNGTARYVSIHIHDGIHASRRDDLEAIIYVLIYLLKGSLPWQGLTLAGAKPHQKYAKVAQKKRTTSLDALCADCPGSIRQALEYVRKLEFSEDPDYSYISDLMVNDMMFCGYGSMSNFDWEDKKKQLL